MNDEEIVIGTSCTFATGIFLRRELSTHEVFNLLMKYKKENNCLRSIIEEGLNVSESEIDEQLEEMMK